MKYLRNEKGAALILVIIVMVVVSILGAALLTTSLADAKHAVRQENVIQANYLARVAVDDVANYIIANKAAPAFVGSVNPLSSGSYVISKIDDISGGAGTSFYIEAKGTAREVSANVGLIVSQDPPSLMLDQAIYTYGDLNIEQMKVSGDVTSAKTITYRTNGSNKYDTDVYTARPGITKHYDSPIVEDTYRDGTSILSTSDGDKEIIAGGTYALIEVDNNSTLTFNTNGGTLTVGVMNMYVKSNGIVHVTGGGTLKLYVYGLLESNGSWSVDTGTMVELLVDSGATADFQTPLTVNPNEDPNKFYVYLEEGSTLKMQAGGNDDNYYNWYIIGPKATIIMQAGVTVNGAIIGNILDGQGNKPGGAVNYISPSDNYVPLTAGFRRLHYTKP